MTDLLPVSERRALQRTERRTDPAVDRDIGTRGRPARTGGARHLGADRRPGLRHRASTDVDVVIPLTVIEELDGLKTRLDDVGRAARAALRAIEELRVRNGGSLAEPVPLGDGSTPADRDQRRSRSTCSSSTASTRRCPTTASSAPPSARPSAAPTTMVSNDAALRIKAAHLGVAAAEHRRARRAGPTRRRSAGSTIETTYDVDRLPVRRRRARRRRGRRRRVARRARTSSPCCAPARSRR